MLAALGMRVTVAGPEIGAAAAIKMVRSVMIKGIEALTLECFLAAARAGVVDEVAASLKNNYPGLDWAKVIPYNLERMASHGERRAAEMEEVAATLRELGVEPLMAARRSSASAKWAGSARSNRCAACSIRTAPRSSTPSAPPRATGIGAAHLALIPANAGIQRATLDSRLRGNSGKHSPSPLDRFGQEIERRLRRALLAVEVDIDEAEAPAVAFRPFEIVEQRPGEIAFELDAVGERAARRGDMFAQVSDAIVVVHDAVGRRSGRRSRRRSR